jgi:cell division protein FtsL
LTVKQINSKENKSQVVRHKIAQLASEIECHYQYINSLKYQTKDLSNNKSIANLISIQILDKVSSKCFEIIGSYNSFEDHPLGSVIKSSKMIQVTNNIRDLHETISKSVIDK